MSNSRTELVQAVGNSGTVGILEYKSRLLSVTTSLMDANPVTLDNGLEFTLDVIPPEQLRCGLWGGGYHIYIYTHIHTYIHTYIHT